MKVKDSSLLDLIKEAISLLLAFLVRVMRTYTERGHAIARKAKNTGIDAANRSHLTAFYRSGLAASHDLEAD